MLHSWSERPVPLHAGLNWAGGNTASAGICMCVCSCMCVCCRIGFLKDQLLSTRYDTLPHAKYVLDYSSLSFVFPFLHPSHLSPVPPENRAA